MVIVLTFHDLCDRTVNEKKKILLLRQVKQIAVLIEAV